MAGKTKSLEQSLEELNDIISKLESDDIALDDSFKLYNDGMKLLKNCNDSIDKVEKKIIILNENGETNEL